MRLDIKKLKIGVALAILVLNLCLANSILAMNTDALSERANQGDVEAQNTLGVFYHGGLLAPKDDAKAFFWFQKAADQGDASGQFRLGDMYANGWGVPKDIDNAIAWYRKAAEQGNARAQGQLRRMYINGELMPTLDEQAGDWWRKLVIQANSEAEIFSRTHAAAENGDPEAQVKVGILYLTGVGVPNDREKATVWFGRAAERGHPDGQCIFAALNAANTAWRVANDNARAVDLCLKAANAGYADAQVILAVHYEMGRGVPKDKTQAQVWWFKAAEQGRSDAELHIDGIYLRGDGVPKDKAESMKWLLKAAEQGSPEALSELNLRILDAKLNNEDVQIPNTIDVSNLSNFTIEHAYDQERDFLPNLWRSPLNGIDRQQSLNPWNLGVVFVEIVLSLAIVTSVVMTWAWGKRGIIGAFAIGPTLGFIVVLIAYVGGGSHPPISSVLKIGPTLTAIWWFAAIPGIAIGLAVNRIISPKVEGSVGSRHG